MLGWPPFDACGCLQFPAPLLVRCKIVGCLAWQFLGSHGLVAEERREEEERRRISAEAAQVRSAAAAECKKLVTDASSSCYRFKPAPKFWRYLQ